MRKIFLDCGANNGCSVQKFVKTHKDYKEWVYHCFEPNKSLHESIKRRGKENGLDLTVHHCALTTYDGTTKFYDNWSIEPKHHRRNKNRRESTIPTLDFNKWVLENIKSDDYVFFKFDIEGSEYDIIDAMYNSGALNLIDEAHGELHSYKCGKTFKDDLRLLKQLDEFLLVLWVWDAQNNNSSYKKRTYDTTTLLLQYKKWADQGRHLKKEKYEDIASRLLQS